MCVSVPCLHVCCLQIELIQQSGPTRMLFVGFSWISTHGFVLFPRKCAFHGYFVVSNPHKRLRILLVVFAANSFYIEHTQCRLLCHSCHVPIHAHAHPELPYCHVVILLQKADCTVKRLSFRSRGVLVVCLSRLLSCRFLGVFQFLCWHKKMPLTKSCHTVVNVEKSVCDCGHCFVL